MKREDIEKILPENTRFATTWDGSGEAIVYESICPAIDEITKNWNRNSQEKTISCIGWEIKFSHDWYAGNSGASSWQGCRVEFIRGSEHTLLTPSELQPVKKVLATCPPFDYDNWTLS